MTAHRTAGQLRALRELCALARTGLDVCDVLAAKGAEDDDRPRAWMISLERWTRGEESGPQLAARTRAMERARERELTADHKIPPPATLAQGLFGDALHWIADARADLTRNPGHTKHHVERVCAHLATALSAVTGDAEEAARAQVDEWRRRHRVAVAAEETERERAALTAKLKDDKAAAELVLGTAQEMGR